MIMELELCARCEDPAELIATTLGMLCEDCTWVTCELDGEGRILQLVEQAPAQESQAQTQQGQQ